MPMTTTCLNHVNLVNRRYANNFCTGRRYLGHVLFSFFERSRSVLSDSQLVVFDRSGRVFRHELLDALDKVGLFRAGDADFVPVVENLLQLLHFEFVEVGVLQVDFLVVLEVADLSVLFLQLLAHFFRRHSPTHGFRHFPDDVGGGIGAPADVVAKSHFLILGRLAPLFEGFFDDGRVGLVGVGERPGELGHHADADFALVRFFLGDGNANAG